MEKSENKARVPAIFVRVMTATPAKIQASGRQAVEGFEPKMVAARRSASDDGIPEIRTSDYVVFTKEELEAALVTAYNDVLAYLETAK